MPLCHQNYFVIVVNSITWDSESKSLSLNSVSEVWERMAGENCVEFIIVGGWMQS